MLAAAMEENPEMDVLTKAAKEYRQNKAKEQKSFESFSNSDESEHESDNIMDSFADNQDNEFVIIDTPPKKGNFVNFKF